MFWRQIIKHFRDEARILYNFSPSDFAVFPKSLKNRPLPRLKKKDEKIRVVSLRETEVVEK